MPQERLPDYSLDPPSRDTPGASASQYCERCQTSEVVEFFSDHDSRPAKSKVASRKVSLGPLLVVSDSCPACKFLDSAVGYDSKPEIRPGDRAKWKLNRYSSLQALGITYSQQSLNEIQDAKMSFIFTLSYGPTSQIDQETQHGFILPCHRNDVEAEMASAQFEYFGRSLTQIPNWQLVSTWLDDCDRKHTLCPRSPVGRPHDLRVLDCDTKDVINLPSEARYMALSYVWGHSEPQNLNLSSSDPLHEQTLADAVSAVKAIGEKYLWIDRICIDQTNTEEKVQLIRRMDVVYEAAYLTLVALVPDSEAGLPGISVHRRQQPTLELPNDKILVTSMRTLEDALTASDWNTRAWTYQVSTAANLSLRDLNQVNLMHGF